MSGNIYKILIGLLIVIILAVGGILVYFSFFAPKSTSVKGTELTPTPTDILVDTPSSDTPTDTPTETPSGTPIGV